MPNRRVHRLICELRSDGVLAACENISALLGFPVADVSEPAPREFSAQPRSSEAQPFAGDLFDEMTPHS